MIYNAKTGVLYLDGVAGKNDPARVLNHRRAHMVVSRRQARLALGEEMSAVLDAASEDISVPWPMRDAIKSSHEWHRTAPEVDELAWLLGLSGEDIDQLFTAAMAL